MAYIDESMQKKLRQLLDEAKTSIGAAAKEMGMARQSLSGRINGTMDFTREDMIRFAKIVDRRPQDIFF